MDMQAFCQTHGIVGGLGGRRVAAVSSRAKCPARATASSDPRMQKLIDSLEEDRAREGRLMRQVQPPCVAAARVREVDQLDYTAGFRFAEDLYSLSYVVRIWSDQAAEDMRERVAALACSALASTPGSMAVIGRRIAENGRKLHAPEILMDNSTYCQAHLIVEGFLGHRLEAATPNRAMCIYRLSVNGEQELRELMQWLRADRERQRELQRQQHQANAAKAGQRDLEELRRTLDRKGQLLSVDIEAWERDQNVLLEVGATLFSIDGSVERPYHFIIAENSRRRNGRFVPDRKSSYNFGRSSTMSLARVTRRLNGMLKEVAGVVGHDCWSDITFMQRAGVQIPENLRVFDTNTLAKLRIAVRQNISLKNMLVALEIPHKNLHNGGNDAFYTMQALRRLVQAEDLGHVKLPEAGQPRK